MLNTALSCELAIALLGTYVSEIETCQHKNLFKNVHSGINSPKVGTSLCLITYKWINMWHIHAMKYYLTIKSNEVLIYAEKLMNLENIMSSERN